MAVVVSTPGSPSVGSAAEEAARLVQTLHEMWTERAPGVDDDTGHPGEATGEATGETAGETTGETTGEPGGTFPCRYCPWCRFLGSAQSLRPELVQQVLATAESVVALLRELARPDVHDATPPPPGSPSSERVRTVTIPVESEDAEQQRNDQPGGH